MYSKLEQYLNNKGLKIKADENAGKAEVIKAEYKAKEKVKVLTQSERLERIEKILGL